MDRWGSGEREPDHNLVTTIEGGELSVYEPEPGTSTGSSSLRKSGVHSLDSSLSDDLSDDENICRSPAKSPTKKLSADIRHLSSRPEEEEEEQAAVDTEPPGGLPSDQDFEFKRPKFRKKKFQFHPFLRSSEDTCVPDPSRQPVEVVIPEQLAASYGLYIWPSAPVLAWYIWLNQEKFIGKRVLELGAGTALPGLLAAKLGASQVILTDSARLPHCVENCQEGVQLNNLQDKVRVQPLTWGHFTSSTLRLKDSLDFVIGSDLFFDPEVFEPLVVTVSWLLEHNPGAVFICTVQERAADWSIEALLLRWKLCHSVQYPGQFLKGTGISESDLTGNHQVFVLKIWKM